MCGVDGWMDIPVMTVTIKRAPPLLINVQVFSERKVAYKIYDDVIVNTVQDQSSYRPHLRHLSHSEDCAQHF